MEAGKAEVQAAHIWSVADGGPDIVQNGIALSATCHWLFDRHLISLGDEYGLLVSHNRVPSAFRSLFENQIDRIHLPSDKRLWPRLRLHCAPSGEIRWRLGPRATSLTWAWTGNGAKC